MSSVEYKSFTPKSLLEATRAFDTPEKAHDYLVKVRWSDDVIGCPGCGCSENYYLATQRRWKCKGCKKQFSVKNGTIFEASPIGLDKWLIAVWLIVNAKNGISSCELARALNVTQKTAWFMNHRIRLALENGSFEKLSGTVEADETYIGGKLTNMHFAQRQAKSELYGSRGSGAKSIVLGMLERGGNVQAKVIGKTNRKTLTRYITKSVERESVLMTDEHGGYEGMKHHYVHQIINHANEYVRDNVHTNGIENFWSLLKRGLKGTYISVEPYHLSRYVAEQVFRFNTRKDNDGGRFEKALAQIAGRRLTYIELTGKGMHGFGYSQ